ncbi:MAG TPA: MotA/TolQ/ExbB proton channel family protein [Planctomycetaceae bacterium]|nr:MotA/TolQ/ExbB proton channel family protein [Planctomycetaceae bacterium]
MEASQRGVWLVLVTAGLIGAGMAAGERAAWAFQGDPLVDPAADPGMATPAGPAPSTPAKPPSLLEWLVRSSGVFGFVLLLVAFVMVGLIFSQLLRLRREDFIPPALGEQIERLLDDKNYQGAYETAQSSDSFLGRVLAAGLARVPRGYDDALQGMQEIGDLETLRLEQSIGYQALIASVAPMIGLLGTVQGLALSLYVIAGDTTSLRPHELSEGIATALSTTLMGLCVAIPALVSYTLFKNRLARFVMEAGFLSEELMKRFRGVGRATVPVPALRPGATVGLAQQA